MAALGIALSVLIGVSLGFFGGGSSILTVPLFVYAFDLEPKVAIASSLIVVGIASAAAMVQHWRHRARQRLHERPRRVRHRARFAPFDRRDGRIHRGRDDHGVRASPSARSRVMQALASLACGILFGAGLAVGGMTNPAKVLAFLDVAGAWDPTLAFVMAGALAVNAAAYAMTRRRAGPLLSGAFALPARREIDAALLGGAALFGMGWGIVGLCPGPALASLARGEPEVAVFVAAMVGGMLLERRVGSRAAKGRRAPSPDDRSELRAA